MTAATPLGAWSFKMTAFLTSADLAEYIRDGAGALLNEDAQVNPHFADNKKKDAKALAATQLSISDNLISVVQDKTTAKAAWDALCARFRSAGLAQELYVRRQFYRTTMAEGESVMQHVEHMRALADELESLDAKIRERNLCMTVLGAAMAAGLEAGIF